METACKGPIIQVTALRKEYPVGEEVVVALKSIDLAIPRGEICCIFGTSGSGKSTLLNQLAGMEKPTRRGPAVRHRGHDPQDRRYARQPRPVVGPGRPGPGGLGRRPPAGRIRPSVSRSPIRQRVPLPYFYWGQGGPGCVFFLNMLYYKHNATIQETVWSF